MGVENGPFLLTSSSGRWYMEHRREDLKMATERIDGIHAFRAFLDEQLANGGVCLTPAQALNLWEIQNAGEDEENEVIEAVQRGFADFEAGRVKPAREAWPSFLGNTTFGNSHELPSGVDQGCLRGS